MNRPKIAPALRWEVWERDDFRCAHCGSRRYLSIDHIIPVSAGGKTEKSNLQTLCRFCNSRKYTALPFYPHSLGLIIMDFTEPHLNMAQAAQELGRPRSTIYRWAAAGRIVGIKLGGVLFIPKSEVKRFGDNLAARVVHPGG